MPGLLGVTPMPPRVPCGWRKNGFDAAAKKACRSRISRRLEQGRRVTLGRAGPAAKRGYRRLYGGARQLEQAGADAITIADCPIGPRENGFQPAGLQNCRGSWDQALAAYDLPRPQCERNDQAAAAWRFRWKTCTTCWW
ncbi:MAG: hypothetical protein ACLUHE_17170 [Christensenellales bacterium]